MLEIAVATISFAGFLIFLLPIPQRRWFAILGWVALVGILFVNFPEYFAENNIVYPIVAILSLPVLWVTVKRLAAGDETVFCLTRGAAIGFLIFAPFAYIQLLGDWLIGVNVTAIESVLNLIGFDYSLSGWNTFVHGIFRVKIVLGCTGIQAIALILGIAMSVPSTLKQKGLVFLAVVPTIVVMNVIRNLFVILAYTEQWFPYFPEIASNGEIGYESYFWSHNIISEFGISLLTVVLVGIAIITIIPDLKTFFTDLLRLYYADLREMVKGSRAITKDT